MPRIRFNPFYLLYREVTRGGAPAVERLLKKRLGQGKEDPLRLRERLGQANVARPAGKLTWVHAASVGEANSVLPLLEEWHGRYPSHALLLTSGTVTSAQLMQRKLPSYVIHHYAPVDTPQAAKQFLQHWKPDFALFVESELWPNLLTMTRDMGCRMALINARMSEHSFRRWRFLPWLIRPLLACFDVCFAQSEEDAVRLKKLGHRNVLCVGNLKLDAPALPVDTTALHAAQRSVGQRPLWLAASIHPGEEVLVAQAHRMLKQRFPDILTLLVPRHPAKAKAMQEALWEEAMEVQLRSEKAQLDAEDEVDMYIADTLGELGLWYRLSPIVFMGGSLIEHGGQNPLEAARLDCAIVYGPHMFNFHEVCQALEAVQAASCAADAGALAAQVQHWLEQPELREGVAQAALRWARHQAHVSSRIVDALQSQGWA